MSPVRFLVVPLEKESYSDVTLFFLFFQTVEKRTETGGCFLQCFNRDGGGKCDWLVVGLHNLHLYKYSAMSFSSRPCLLQGGSSLFPKPFGDDNAAENVMNVPYCCSNFSSKNLRLFFWREFSRIGYDCCSFQDGVQDFSVSLCYGSRVDC